MIRILALVPLLLLVSCGGSGGSGGSGGGPDVDLESEHIATELVLAITNPGNDEEAEEVKQTAGGVAMERIGDSPYYLLRIPAGTDLGDVLDELEGDLRVEDVVPNYLGRGPEGGPSDAPTFGDDAYALIPSQPALGPLALDAAHAFSTGAGVVVAVVDTGIDFAHPFFAGRIAPGGFDFVDADMDPSEVRNFVDEDADGRTDEQFGHGTFVASLVLAAAPDAMILPVRVLNDEGIGTVATVAAGILHAVSSGAKVINVSVDIPESAGAVKDAIERARDAGAMVVAAAGNEGQEMLIFPARYSGVVAVTALRADGVVAPFANRDSRIALAAPGVDLLGAVPLSLNPQGTAVWSGTSFATPLVAGSAALLFSIAPDLGADEALDLLRASAVPVDPLNPGLAGKLGAGRVHPLAALQP